MKVFHKQYWGDDLGHGEEEGFKEGLWVGLKCEKPRVCVLGNTLLVNIMPRGTIG